MLKKFYMTKGKLMTLVVTLCVLLGEAALTNFCVGGIYEPTKPDILKSED